LRIHSPGDVPIHVIVVVADKRRRIDIRLAKTFSVSNPASVRALEPDSGVQGAGVCAVRGAEYVLVRSKIFLVGILGREAAEGAG